MTRLVGRLVEFAGMYCAPSSASPKADTPVSLPFEGCNDTSPLVFEKFFRALPGQEAARSAWSGGLLLPRFRVGAASLRCALVAGLSPGRRVRFKRQAIRQERESRRGPARRARAMRSRLGCRAGPL